MIYEPREDSYLLQKFVNKYAKGKALDMGTGAGILALEAAKKARSVLAVDISGEAVEYCKKHVKNKKIKFKRSDLFNSLTQKFNLITFNPPYLPEDYEEAADVAQCVTGGKKGYETLGRFFAEANNYLEDNGKILILFSSLTNKEKVDEIIANFGFEFKQLTKKRLPMFEDLYVYLITKSNLLKRLKCVRDIKKIAKGHRGIVYKGYYKNKEVAIKVDGNTAAVNRLDNEVKYLKLLNHKQIGPKLLFYSKDYIVMDFVNGERIWEYMQHSSRNQIKRVIREVFEQCFTMDQMKLNKEEMHHPVKHVIITDSNVTLIDFERCRKTPNPKNVTQFCQFLTSGSFAYGLENKGLVINKKILRMAQKYKCDQTRKNFEMILDEI